MANLLFRKYTLGGVRNIPTKTDMLGSVRESVDARTAQLRLKELGKRIARNIGFDESDGTMVVVRGNAFEKIY